jgi:hypothetical protein
MDNEWTLSEIARFGFGHRMRYRFARRRLGRRVDDLAAIVDGNVGGLK